MDRSFSIRRMSSSRSHLRLRHYHHLVHEALESRALLSADPSLTEFALFGENKVVIAGQADVRHGFVGSNGNVKVGHGSTIDSIFAGGKVHLDRNVVVDGDVRTNHRVHIGRNSNLTGSVDAARNVQIGRDSRIEGDITAAEQVNLHGHVFVGGTVTEYGTPREFDSISPPTASSIVVDPERKIRTDPHDQIVMTPGTYGDVNIDRFNTVKLSSGEYYFERFHAKRGLQLQLDVSLGPIDIFASGKIWIERGLSVEVTGGDATDIYVETHGSFRIAPVSSWSGTVFAPFGNIEIDRNSSFVGAAYAQKIGMHRHVHFDFQLADRLHGNTDIAPVVSAFLINDTGMSNSDEITSDLSLQGTVTDDGPIAGFTLTVPELSAVPVDVTPFVNPMDGQFSIAYSELQTRLGSFVDGAYTLRLQAEDQAGNRSSFEELTVVLDSFVASPITAGFDDDTGVANTDSITNDSTLIFHGTTEPKSTVILSETTLGSMASSVADSNGDWIVDASSVVLTDGSYSFSVVAEDVAGNVSVPSAPVFAIVDLTSPTAPSILSVADDTGESSTDGVTNDASLLFSGIAEPSVVVTLTESLWGVIGTATTALDGSWSIVPVTSLADGFYSFLATAVDLAGNASAKSSISTVQIDTQAPAAPVISGVEEDTGFHPSDGITNDSIPVLFGNAEPGSLLTLFESVHGNIGTTTVDAHGNWSLILTSPDFDDRPLTLTVDSMDAAGNVSALSHPFVLDVDTIFPAQPVFDLDAAFDSPPLGDRETIFETVTLSGKTDPGAQVELLEAGLVTLADGSGNFLFAGVALALGPNNLTALATDVAGNQRSFATTISRIEDADNTPPTLNLQLANDTSPSPADQSTTDPTLLGQVTDASDFELELEIHLQRIDETVTVDLTGIVDANGSFSLPAQFFASLVDGTYPYGTYELSFRATDEFHNQTIRRYDISHEIFPSVDATAPELTVSLLNDTGPNLADRFTTDPTIQGSVKDEGDLSVYLDIFLDQTDETFFADITSTIRSDGSFLMDPNDLEGIIGKPLPYGFYEVSFLAIDSNLNREEQILLIGHESPTGNDLFGPQLDVALNSGLPGHNPLTNDPSLMGVVVDPGGVDELLIEVYVEVTDTYYNDNITSLISADGTFSLDFDYFQSLIGILPHSLYEVSFEGRDTAGNSSVADQSFTFVRDNSGLPNLLAFLANDDGANASDNVTSDPTISGHVSDDGVFDLVVQASSNQFGNVIVPYNHRVNPDGSFVIDKAFLELIFANPLPEDSYEIQVIATDNFGSTTRHINFTIGEVIPAVISGISIDTGIDNNDGMTSDPTLLVSGIAKNSSLVHLHELTLGLLGTSFADGTGQWSIDLTSQSLDDGLFSFVATYDDQGILVYSDPFPVVIDQQPPISADFGLSVPSDTGILGDAKTTLETVTLEGTTEPNATIVLLDSDMTTVSDAAGRFALANVSLRPGEQTYSVEISDLAGNSAVFDSVITRDVTLSINEANGEFVNELVFPVSLESDQATRGLSFQLEIDVDTSDSRSVIEDTLLVYLVDPANPSQTLIDRGESGTALLMVAGDQVEYLPGFVRFDGSRVEIDVSSVAGNSDGLLVIQLINSDTDTGTIATLRQVSNGTDIEDERNLALASNRMVVDPGAPLNLSQLNPTAEIDVAVENVRVDSTTGRYSAELQLRNNGAPIGRQVAVSFPGLPSGVSIANGTGVDIDGTPYISMKNAILSGGLDSKNSSGWVKLEIDNPLFELFALTPEVQDAGANQRPVIDPIPILSVNAGGFLAYDISATDADDDALTYFIRSTNGLPTGEFTSEGSLRFAPSPDQIGSYEFQIVATDGILESAKTATLHVTSDPITTTRISGVVLNTDSAPLAGLPIELGTDQTVTAADGTFTLRVSPDNVADALFIRGEVFSGSAIYPFIAEKIPLLLGRDLFENVNNVIGRPIYLPALDVANGQTIDPLTDMTVTTPTIPGASVFVAAGTLEGPSGNLFHDVLSITEVPAELTPAALPPTLFPDLVVTIQPGEMQFVSPAPLSLPNLVGYLPGTQMDLWSINPETGQFDNVGTGQVSADGSVVETVSGGIRNSSWHFFAPFGPQPQDPEDPHNLKHACDDCEERDDPNDDNQENSDDPRQNRPDNHDYNPADMKDFHQEQLRGKPAPSPETKAPSQPTNRDDSFFGGGRTIEVDPNQGNTLGGPRETPKPTKGRKGPNVSGRIGAVARSPLTLNGITSETEISLHAGALYKRHDLVTYDSLGVARGLVLTYDSERADARPIIHVGFDNTQSNLPNPVMASSLTIFGGDASEPYTLPGSLSGLVPTGAPVGKPAIQTPQQYLSVAPSATNADGAIQATALKSAPTGRYAYVANTRIANANAVASSGVTAQSQGKLVHVNQINSPFGAGWGISGLLKLVENYDGSVLLIDGDGSESVFEPPAVGESIYESPPGDFSHLEKLGDDTFRRTTPDQTVYQFNAKNELASITDRNGNVTQFLYDASNRLEKVMDPVGLETTLAYENGRIQSITDPALRQTRFTMDIQGNLTSITDPDNTIRQFEYDSRHRLTREIDKRGNREETHYDFAGRVTDVTRKDGSSVRYTPVQTQGLVPISLQLDPTTAPAAFQLGSKAMSQFADANGNVTIAELDRAGQRITSTDGIGERPSVDRNDDNLITRSTDGRGNVTLLTYDARGNVTSISDPISRTVHSAPLFPGVFYQTGTSPTQVVTGDVNNDGFADAITANHGSDSVSVLLGLGDGYFQYRRSYSVTDVRSVELIDLDDDTNLDIVTANRNDRVSILINNGDGTYGSVTNYVTGAGANFVRSADFDADGDRDLLTVNNSGNSVSLLLNAGDGTFASQVEYSVADAPASAAIGDINSDGILDIITANDRTTDNLTLLFGNGAGTFGGRVDLTISGTAQEAIQLADVNNDSTLDIVTAGGSQFLSVLTGNGDGTFASAVTYPYVSGGGGSSSPPFHSHLTAGDVDADADIDIVVAERGPDTVTVFTNDGSGKFAAHESVDVVSDPVSVSLNDMNLDGIQDVVVMGNSSRRIMTLFGNPDAMLSSTLPKVPTDTAAGDGAQSVIAVDLNHDNHLDLVTGDSNTGSISIFLGVGDGTFANRTTVAAGSQAYTVNSADMNNDTHEDLIVVNRSSDQVSILFGDGAGAFAAPLAVNINDQAFKSSIGDLDNDNDLDLVIGGGGSFSVVLNNGDGTFAPGVISSSQFGTNRQALGDLNGDNFLDLVVSQTGSSAQTGNRVRVRMGNGDGTFGSSTIYAVSSTGFFREAPAGVELADVDSDNDLDIIAIDADGDRVGILLGNGNGTFAGVQFYSVGDRPREVQLADLNGDQILDLATTNRDSDTVTVRLGDGSGEFPVRMEFEVGDSPRSVALGDFDGDGDNDMVVANRNDDSISIRFNSTSGAEATANTARRFEYDPVFHQMTRMIDELGHETIMQIDPANGDTLSVTQVIGGLGGGDDLVTQYTYTPEGLVDTITDPLGRVTDHDYDTNGRLEMSTFAVGTTEEAYVSFEYDEYGNTSAVVDELTHRTEYEYDELNRLIRVIETDPDGPGPLASPERDYDYDDFGNLIQVTDALKNTIDYEYDHQHRLIRKTDTNNSAWVYNYDTVGNVISTKDRIGRTTAYQYDDRNRLIEMTDAEGFRERYRYDVDNNRIRTIDRNGGVWQTVFDARNRPLATIDARGQVTRTEFDRVDNVIAQTDELLRRTEMVYDDVYRLVRVTRPDPDDSGPEIRPLFEYNYDLASNLRLTTDALGNATEYFYDKRDRIIRQIDPDPDGPGPLLSPKWVYQYDDANRLIRTADPLDRETSFVYDDLNRLRTTRFPDPDGATGPDPIPELTFTYDSIHNRTASTDALGNTTLFGYDDLYRIITVTDPDPDGPGPLASPVTRMTYDAESQLQSVRDPLDRVTSYDYDQLGRMTQEIKPDPDGAGPDASPEMTYAYDGVGNEVSMKDALGNVTQYEYDELYRVTKTIQPDPDGPLGPETNPINLLTYDAADQLIASTDALGRITRYEYDKLGRVIAQIDPDPDGAGPQPNPVKTYVFDLMDNELSMTDALGNVTRYEYDHLYRMVAVIQEDPDGAGPQRNPTTSIGYDIASQRISTTDPLGRVSSYVYDDLGRVIREIYPDPDGAGPLASPEMNYAYDLMSNELSMTDAVGNITAYEYDHLYRLVRMIEEDPDGSGPLDNPVSQYTYDIASQRLTESDPLNRTMTYEYDDLGRVTRAVQPDPDGAGPLLPPEMSYVYDLMDNELSMTDPLGHVTGYEYDHLYRVIRQIEEDLDGAGPLGRPTTKFSYDLVSNRLSLTDPVGNQTDFVYDDLDRLVTETIELGTGNPKSRRFEYDLEDNLIRRTDRNDRVMHYEYDQIYRVVAETWVDVSSTIVNTIQFEFDEASQLLRAEDVTIGSRYDYTYDDLSRVTQSIANNGGPSIVFANLYDAQNRRTDQTTTIGGVADYRNVYHYDGLNRLSQLDQFGQIGGHLVAEKRVDFYHNADDQLTSISRYKDILGGASDLVMSSSYKYDGIGRLVEMSHFNPISTIVDYDWIFDSASRITQFVSSMDGTSDYKYDNGNQLTDANYTTQSDEVYGYDEAGNRTGSGYATGFYNRLSFDGAYRYEYDSEGNRTQRTHVSTGEVREFEWDHRNRLVSVTDRSAGSGPVSQSVQHRYDVFNRWISKQVDADGDGSAAAETTRYEYDESQIVLEFDDSDFITNRYLWGPLVDQVLADEQVGDQVYWPAGDHLGTVRDVVDSLGNHANHIVYDSFGNVTSETNSTINHLFGFTGRAFEKTTNLQNNLNRWYDPQVGRWASEDPIDFKGGDGNLYRYVGNNSTGAIDPSGNIIIFVHGIRNYNIDEANNLTKQLNIQWDSLSQARQEVIHFQYGRKRPTKPFNVLHAWNDTWSTENRRAGVKLGRLMTDLRRQRTQLGSNEPIHVVAYSNGSNVVFHAALSLRHNTYEYDQYGAVLLLGGSIDEENDLTMFQGLFSSLENFSSRLDTPTWLVDGVGNQGLKRRVSRLSWATQHWVDSVYHSAGGLGGAGFDEERAWEREQYQRRTVRLPFSYECTVIRGTYWLTTHLINDLYAPLLITGHTENFLSTRGNFNGAKFNPTDDDPVNVRINVTR